MAWVSDHVCEPGTAKLRLRLLSLTAPGGRQCADVVSQHGPTATSICTAHQGSVREATPGDPAALSNHGHSWTQMRPTALSSPLLRALTVSAVIGKPTPSSKLPTASS